MFISFSSEDLETSKCFQTLAIIFRIYGLGFSYFYNVWFKMLGIHATNAQSFLGFSLLQFGGYLQPKTPLHNPANLWQPGSSCTAQARSVPTCCKPHRKLWLRAKGRAHTGLPPPSAAGSQGTHPTRDPSHPSQQTSWTCTSPGSFATALFSVLWKPVQILAFPLITMTVVGLITS